MPIRVRRAQTVASLLFLLILLVISIGCGGGNGGTPTSPTPTISGISISPTSANLTTGQTKQFNAVVTGTGAFNSQVSWSVNGTLGGNATIGNISAMGSYTAPSIVPASSKVSVTATSLGDTSKSASASVSISLAAAPTPTILSISPTEGAPGDELTVTGENFGTLVQTVVFSGPSGIPIATLVDAGAQTSLTVKVPLEAVSGPLIVQVPSATGTTPSSNAEQFTRLPDLRIRAGQKDLGSGESTAFQTVTFGDPVVQTIVWSTDQGSISTSGEYLAPGTVPADTFAHVSGCIQGTKTCDTVLLGLHPFRVSPDAPTVALGQEFQMQGLVSGMPVSATWSQIAGGGSIQSNGTYTASNVLSDGGSALLSAAYQGTNEQAYVSVTGAFPGIVNRLYDYLDLTTSQIQRVTQPLSIAVYANRAYVLAAQLDAAALDQNFLYIDVYDLTDPSHPRWITAVEAANRGQLRAYGGILYDIGDTVGPQVLSAYDISAATPVLVGRIRLPELFSFSFFGGVVTATEQSAYAADAIATVDEFVLRNGNITETQISVPAAISGPYAIAAASVEQSRLYVTEESTSGSASSILASYDLSQSPPILIGTVPLPETTLTSDSFGNGSLFFTDNKVFDVTKDPPVLESSLPETMTVIDADATRVLGQSIANGSAICVQLVDVSVPSTPRATADLCDFVNGFARTEQARFNGSVVYSAEEMGGLTVYDVSASGGQHFLAQVGDPEPGGFVAYGQVANTTTLFAAGFDKIAGIGGVKVYNLQTQPPTLLGFISTGAAASNNVSLSGNNLFVGTAQDLQIFDVSQPNQPNQLGSVNVVTDSLAASGSDLFVGSADGHLLVYNTATPASPVLLSTVALPDTSIQMVLDGTLLLVADRTGGLLTFNVSAPSHPILVSQLTVSPAVFGVQADGTTVLLAALEAGLVVVDLSSPSAPKIISEAALDSDNPFETGFSDFRSRAVTVAVYDKIAFLGINNMDPNGLDNGVGSVYGFDYSRPLYPRLVSSARFTPAVNGSISSMLITDTDLFVSGVTVGLVQADISNPRNLVDLYYPPSALRPPFPTSPPFALAATKRASRRSELRRKIVTKPLQGR